MKCDKKEFIDRNAFLESLQMRSGRIAGKTLAAEILTKLKQFPVSDVAPVVRCRDCNYFCKDKLIGLWCFKYEAEISPDEFCSKGEREEEKND